MDAELCRRLGAAKGTPWWRYRSASNEEFDEQMIQAGLKAKTLEGLPPEIVQFLDLCDRSFEVAEKMEIRDYNDPEQLRKIIDAVIDEQPTIDAETDEEDE